MTLLFFSQKNWQIIDKDICEVVSLNKELSDLLDTMTKALFEYNEYLDIVLVNFSSTNFKRTRTIK